METLGYVEEKEVHELNPINAGKASWKNIDEWFGPRPTLRDKTIWVLTSAPLGSITSGGTTTSFERSEQIGEYDVCAVFAFTT